MPTAHWVRRNETSRAPNRWIWLDTEANVAEHDGGNVQTWRLGVTAADWLNEKRRTWQGPEWQRHETPADLWAYVDGFTRASMRTVVMAHNMGYDVRISQAIPQLQTLGWELIRWQVSDQGCVLKYRRESRALWLVDSYSWLSQSLARIGSLIAQDKVPLPAWDADDADWWRRCETDVTILRAAMLPLVKWVRDDDLGNWQPTAGSMAWANWRHRHYSHPVLVHDDEHARTAERAAGYTGRCEAWRHGRLPHGEWVEWDFPLAYPRVCLDTPLPTILRGRCISPSLKTVLGGGQRNRFLVYADIRQDQPVLPTRQDGKILWPVGTFTGWYWDNEIAQAVEHGTKVRPLTAYRYSARLALAEWAEWIIGVVEDQTLPYSLIQRAAAKGWARALIGRFGTRYWDWEDWGPDDHDGVRMDWLVDYDTKEVGRILHVAGKMFGATQLVEGANSVPSIMSAIMAECRVRLWRAMRAAGFENLAYCDTDSVIVNQIGDYELSDWLDAGQGWGMRRKSTWRNLTVMAPRQLILDDHHRVSGVSAGAERVGPLAWAGERWEGLTQAAEHGRSTAVMVRPTLWQLQGTDNRRRHLPDGSTGPIAVRPAPTTAKGA